MTSTVPTTHTVAPYIGRFAPSPTGTLHAGSLVAALASWLDARAHGGRWLVRIEDVDAPRCVPGAADTILHQLARCGLLPDEAPVWQSERGALYQAALDDLISRGLAYPCTCSRKAIAEANAARGLSPMRGHEAIYPGTCRPTQHSEPRPPLTIATAQRVAWRLDTGAVEKISSTALDSIENTAISSGVIQWHDRRSGLRAECVSHAVGDFVLRRADQLWAYQLAVVVDDAAQGITDVVRGEDLVSNTARQILLQRALGLTTPRYLHTPLVLGDNGEKLSKQNGAAPLVLDPTPLPAIRAALQALGLPVDAAALTETHTLSDWLHWATGAWAERYGLTW